LKIVAVIEESLSCWKENERQRGDEGEATTRVFQELNACVFEYLGTDQTYCLGTEEKK